MNMNPKSFTIEYTGTTDVIVTQCGISEPFDINNTNKHPQITECKATWDTGAMRSVISVGLVERLGLSPIGRTKVYHANGEAFVGVYFINLFLPNQVVCSFLQVTEGDITGTDVLVGMDIISMGDFSITAPQGKTKFSFQIPSTHDIDYVREYNQKNHTLITSGKEHGRNTPCPCGSGKKYKHCCGKNN